LKFAQGLVEFDYQLSNLCLVQHAVAHNITLGIIVVVAATCAQECAACAAPIKYPETYPMRAARPSIARRHRNVFR
jgi:hypothetical protein